MFLPIEQCPRSDARGAKRKYPAAQCPACQDFNSWHKGFEPNGKHRYQCKSCRVSFLVDDAGIVPAPPVNRAGAPSRQPRYCPACGKFEYDWAERLVRCGKFFHVRVGPGLASIVEATYTAAHPNQARRKRIEHGLVIYVS